MTVTNLFKNQSNFDLAAILDQYPFLWPRSSQTGSPLEKPTWFKGQYNIPPGWYKLFFQMCEDLRRSLIKHNLLNDLYFCDIKEKYGALVLYYNIELPLECENIIAKYRRMSAYVCSECGKPATIFTKGWIGAYCDECYDKPPIKYQKDTACTIFEPKFIHHVYSSAGQDFEYPLNCTKEWERLHHE